MAFIHKGKTVNSVSFIGFGRSNKGVFEYLKKEYPSLTFTARTRDTEAVPKELRHFAGSRQYSEPAEDLFFVSPGIRRDKLPLPADMLSSDAELFFEKNSKDVFALTASDGKSTTCALLRELISPSYSKAYAVGNIGEALSPHLNDNGNTAYAVELSSFQLMYLAPRSKRAVISNITPNHLDWHRDYGEYRRAKENIMGLSEDRVFGVDSEPVRELALKYKPFAVFSASLTYRELEKFGAVLSVYLKDSAIHINGKRLIDTREIKKNEPYNIKNFMAAIAAGYGYFTEERLYETAMGFGGLPHRCELVRTLRGTKCYNSSIDSSPERALATLTALEGRSTVLLGGRTKMPDFERLTGRLSEIADAVILYGENRYEIKTALAELAAPVCLIESFEDAVYLAAELSRGSENLILSPASTSFDSFSSFEERGNLFKKIINSL